jgi:hypothetical protein
VVNSISEPPAPDSTTSPIHGSPPASISRTTKSPLPAGINPPENENPRTVLFAVLTVNPASAAAPPDAPVTVAPLTENWNPYKSLLVL